MTITSEDLDAKYLPGFTREMLRIDGRGLRALIGGAGPPVLLIHGDPQTHLCWRRIAPELARARTVVLVDLPGRGESDPRADMAGYAKASLAADMAAVMDQLGFARFSLAGHDRGARVARRLALEYPDRVEALAVMDIIPEGPFYAEADAQIAQDYFYFFFLTQRAPLPERLIGGDPRAFMQDILDLTAGPGAYEPDILEHYLSAASRPAAVKAMCQCFRAGLQIDRVADHADRQAGRRITAPTLVLWGAEGVVGQRFDVEPIWRSEAEQARFQAMPAGHFLPEEAPRETLAALQAHLRSP